MLIRQIGFATFCICAKRRYIVVAMYVCLLTPEFVPHGSRLLPRFPNRNNMAARMSGMDEGPATGEIS